MKYEKYEKNDIVIKFKTNGKIDPKNHQILKVVKEKVFKITNDFRIILLMSEEIDTNHSLKDDEVVIEYYSKPELNETIIGNYLNFLDKFLDIGYEDGVKTVPME
jgi:hypothetical protein